MTENPESFKDDPVYRSEPGDGTADKKPDSNQPVWTYRGYQLRGSEFSTAMVHFFRAEISRANVWRQRLDATTNWAVITTAAVLTMIFGANDTPHLVILLNLLLVTMFLIIEARRYRYYELWSSRIRLMETDFFASMLVPPFQPSPEWAEALAENLLHPSFPISNLEAIGRRLRRNYMWIYMVITVAWFVHILFKPVPVESWSQIVQNASFAMIPGEVVLIVGLVLFLILILFAIITIPMQHSAGEVLPRFPGLSPADSGLTGPGAGQDKRAWFRPTRRRRQLMTLIITDQAKDVTEKIFQEMRRGVTAIQGKGMFTGKEHTVLLCALTITEIPHLRSVVNTVDPQAFVIVSPAQEVFGRGFMPLTKDR
jgi:uncharacterized membrane protein